MKPSVRRKWRDTPRIGWMIELAEHHEASVRAKVEHPFRVVKRQLLRMAGQVRPQAAMRRARHLG